MRNASVQQQQSFQPHTATSRPLYLPRFTLLLFSRGSGELSLLFLLFLCLSADPQLPKAADCLPTSPVTPRYCTAHRWPRTELGPDQLMLLMCFMLSASCTTSIIPLPSGPSFALLIYASHLWSFCFVFSFIQYSQEWLLLDKSWLS